MSPHVATPVQAGVKEEPQRALKILVVDDKLDAAKGLANLLRAYGHEVRLANDAATAMHAALEFVPDVTLLDIGLPVVNGYEVAKWFRQESALRDTILVAVTGYGHESDRQRSREAGFDHHLVKPMDFAKLETILSDVAVKLS